MAAAQTGTRGHATWSNSTMAICKRAARMILGLAAVALTVEAAPARAGAEGCCPPRKSTLSAREMKARLRHTVPVSALAGKDVRIKGTVVFVVGLDSEGNVNCIRFVSGHPMLVPTAMESVKRWKFQAGTGPTCGKLALALSTLEPDMGLQVLSTEPARKRP